MLKIIRELGVKVSLKFDKPAADMMDKSIEKIGSSMKSLGMQVAAAAGAIFGLAEETSRNAYDLKLYSETLGISTERLQELAYAAKIAANVSRDELMGSLDGISGSLDAVRKGNIDAALAYNRLGLSTELITNRNLKADQVMMMVAERIKGVQDPIARAAIANQIFGASGAKLLPLLMKGAAGFAEYGKQARADGVVFSDAQIKRQAAFMQELNRFWFLIKQVAFEIGATLLPVVRQVFHDLTKWIQANRQLIQSGVKEFFLGLAAVLKTMAQVMGFVGAKLKILVDYMGGASKTARALFAAFAIFKGLQLAAGFIQAGVAVVQFGMALAKISFILPALTAAFAGIKTALSVFGMVTGLADVIPALMLAGKALGVALLPVAGYAVAIGAVVVAAHDLWTLLTGGKMEDTWVYKVWTMFKDWISSIGWIKSLFAGGGGPQAVMAGPNEFRSAAPAGSASTALSAGGGAQNNQIQNQFTITVPPGTTAAQATEIVSRGTEDGITSSLRHARNGALGGAAY